MSSETKLLVLRLAAATVLLIMLVFFASQPNDKVWWFWMAPPLAVYGMYRFILSFRRCSQCRQVFSLEPVDRVAYEAVRFPQRMAFRCDHCGHEEMKWVNGPGGSAGGGP